MSSSGWRVIRRGSGEGAVLCLNFTVAGVRAQAGFPDLAPWLPDEYAVWGTDESAWPAASGTPRVQLEEWLDHARTVAAPVRAVFGVCGASALAGVLADRLAGDFDGSGAPPVVLFDPIVVGRRNLLDQAKDSLGQLGVTAPDDLGGTAGGEPAAAAEVGRLATELARRYAEHAAAVGAARSIRAATVAELCARFETYLGYLTLCATAWSYRRAAPDLLVLSRDHPDHEIHPRLRDTPRVRLDATGHQLLAYPEAAQAAARVLAGRTEVAG